MSQYIYMGISYSDILTFLNYFCWCRIIQNKFFIQLFINDSSTVQMDNWWISTLFGRLCHFTFSSFIWTKWLNVMHLSLLSFFMIEADLFLWELCSLCCLFLMKSRFCAPDSHRTWIRRLCLWRGGCCHPHICTLLAFHTAHSLMEESDLNDRSCVQCKGDQGRTCFLSSSLEVRCLEIKWKASVTGAFQDKNSSLSLQHEQTIVRCNWVLDQADWTTSPK